MTTARTNEAGRKWQMPVIKGDKFAGGLNGDTAMIESRTKGIHRLQVLVRYYRAGGGGIMARVRFIRAYSHTCHQRSLKRMWLIA